MGSLSATAPGQTFVEVEPPNVSARSVLGTMAEPSRVEHVPPGGGG